MLSVLPKNRTQFPQPWLEPGPLNPESSTLTMRPLPLPLFKVNSDLKVLVAKRFNRAIKDNIVKYFAYKDTLCYIEVLPQLVSK